MANRLLPRLANEHRSSPSKFNVWVKTLMACRLELLVGLLVGCAFGAFIPMFHEREFFIHFTLVHPLHFGFWQYELWAHVAALFIFISIWIWRTKDRAKFFALGFVFCFPMLTLFRAAEQHSAIATFAGSALVFLVAAELNNQITRLGRRLSRFIPTRSQWNSWTLPSKYSWIGTLGVMFSVGAWLVQPGDILSFMSKKPAEETVFTHHGNVVTLKAFDGRSPQTAIQILGANSDASAVFSEYFWLRKYFPGHAIVSQAIVPYSDPRYPKEQVLVSDGKRYEFKSNKPSRGDRLLDQMTTMNWLGVRESFYFDITDYIAMTETDPSALDLQSQFRKKVLSDDKLKGTEREVSRIGPQY